MKYGTPYGSYEIKSKGRLTAAYTSGSWTPGAPGSLSIHQAYCADPSPRTRQ